MAVRVRRTGRRHGAGPRCRGPPGVSLVIERAAFSERQLKAAAHQLGAFAEATATGLTTELKTDGSGLVVLSHGLAAAARGRAPLSPQHARLLQAIDAVRSRTGVPVTVEDQPAGQARPASRDNDWDPFWGGAVSNNGCTSGFSMYATGAPARFMLTAAHCSGWADGRVAANGADRRMGVTDFIHELFDVREDRYDLGVIRLDSGLTNQGKIYRSEETHDGGLTVKGYAGGGIPAGGNYCVNGHVSTPNCNLISGQQTHLCSRDAPWIPFNRCVWYVSYTSRAAGAIVFCRGDSGGPVYYWSGGNLIAAGAVGFGYGETCFERGGISVVASAVNVIPGLRVVVG